MRIKQAPALRDLTTIRLGGEAICQLILDSDEDAYFLADKIKEYGGKPFFLGNGSNILASDQNLPIILISLSKISIPQIIEDTGQDVLIKVDAGMPLGRLLGFCLKNSLAGLEGLTGIPGTVGGAVAMNAGSFGVEMDRVLHSVSVLEDNEKKIYESDDIHYGYRCCKIGNFDELPLILNATFTLTKGVKDVILSNMHQNILYKKSRQPLDAFSAGCAFKNPEGMAAGFLLEKSGFKGKKRGGMAFSDKHANFLINCGNGSSNAAFDLLSEARNTVWENFGINLETEIRIIP